MEWPTRFPFMPRRPKSFPGPLVLLVALLAAQLAAAVASYRDHHQHRHLDSVAAAINQREPGETISALIGLTGPAEPLPVATTQNQASNSSSTSEQAAFHQSVVGQSNSSLNGTGMGGAGSDQDEEWLMLSTIAAHAIILVIGSLGNAVVILVIMKFTRTETVTDIYILNLAFADLMFLTGLIFLVTTMSISHWIFGNLMCKLYMASTSLNQFASSLLLVVMSFDRFLAVCHPIYAQRFRRIRTAKVICLSIWIICLILMTPIFTYAKTNNNPENPTCAIAWPDNTGFNCELAFTLYAFSIGFALPLLLIACFYLCVIKRLRLAARNQLSGLVSSRRSRSRETTNKRIEHLVIGIICTYTICWLPYWSTQLWVSFSQALDRQQHNASTSAFYAFFLVASCLSYTNSAVNPILYAFLSDNFKRRCSEIIRSVTRIRWCPAGVAKRSSGAKSRAGQEQESRQLADTNHQTNSNHHHLLKAPNSHHHGATTSTACYCEPTEAMATSYAEVDCQTTAAQLVGDLHLGDLKRQQQLRQREAEARLYGQSNSQLVAIKEEKSDKSQCHGV